MKRLLVGQTAVSAIVAVLVLAWILVLGGRDAVDHGLESVRGSLYGALAAVAGALLGFIIASVAILIALFGTESKRVQGIRQSPAYGQIGQVFTSTIRWLGAATLAYLLALLLDHEKGILPDLAIESLRAAVVFVTLVTTARLVTSLVIFERLVAVASKPGPTYSADEG